MKKSKIKQQVKIPLVANGEIWNAEQALLCQQQSQCQDIMLGRGALGEMIENQGYYDVFILTTLIGLFAVALCVIEWVRQARSGRPENAPPPEPELV